jgi:hypothetical protein
MSEARQPSRLSRAEATYYAVERLVKGASPGLIQTELVSRGIPQRTARRVVGKALREFRDEDSPGMRHVIGGFLSVVGLIGIVAGTALFLGNITGLFPTFPHAGLITSTVAFGVLLMGTWIKNV